MHLSASDAVAARFAELRVERPNRFDLRLQDPSESLGGVFDMASVMAASRARRAELNLKESSVRISLGSDASSAPGSVNADGGGSGDAVRESSGVPSPRSRAQRLAAEEERMSAYAERVKAEVIARKGTALRARNAAELFPTEHNMARAMIEVDAELHRRLQPTSLRRELAKEEALQAAQFGNSGTRRALASSGSASARKGGVEAASERAAGAVGCLGTPTTSVCEGCGQDGPYGREPLSPARALRMEQMAKWGDRLAQMLLASPPLAPTTFPAAAIPGACGSDEPALTVGAPATILKADIEIPDMDSDDYESGSELVRQRLEKSVRMRRKQDASLEEFRDEQSRMRLRSPEAPEQARFSCAGVVTSEETVCMAAEPCGERAAFVAEMRVAGKPGSGDTSLDGVSGLHSAGGAGETGQARAEPTDLFDTLRLPPAQYPPPLAEGESAIRAAHELPPRRPAEAAVASASAWPAAGTQPSVRDASAAVGFMRATAVKARRGTLATLPPEAEGSGVQPDTASQASADADAAGGSGQSSRCSEQSARRVSLSGDLRSSLGARRAVAGDDASGEVLSVQRSDGRDRGFDHGRVSLASSVLTHTQVTAMAHRGVDPRPRQAERAKTRYVRPQDGDISQSYPGTVDPEQILAEMKRRKAGEGAVGGHAVLSGRPPFAEAFERRVKAEGNLTFFAPVWPAVDDSWPSFHEMPQPFVPLDFPPEALLPTGTDFDDLPAERVATLLKEITRLVFTPPEKSAAASAGVHGSAGTDRRGTPSTVAGGNRKSAGVLVSEVYCVAPPDATGDELLARQVWSPYADLSQRLPLVPVGIDTSHDRVLRFGRHRGAGQAASATTIAKVNRLVGLWDADGGLGEASGGKGSAMTQELAQARSLEHLTDEDPRLTGLAAEADGSESGSESNSEFGREGDGGPAGSGHSRASDRPSTAGSSGSYASSRGSGSGRRRSEGAVSKKKARLLKRESEQQVIQQAQLHLQEEARRRKPCALPRETRERMESVLSSLEAPLADQIDFASKYTSADHVGGMDEALRLYEAAAAKLNEWRQHKDAMRLATAREVGVQCYNMALEIKRALGDEPSFRGNNFTEFFGEYVPEVAQERRRLERLKEGSLQSNAGADGASLARPQIA